MADNEKKMETVQRLLLAQIAEIRNDLPNFIDSIMQTITEPGPRATNLLYILIDICNVLSIYSIGDRKYRPPSLPSFMKKNTQLRPQLIQAETEILESFQEEIAPAPVPFHVETVIDNKDNNNNNNTVHTPSYPPPLPTPIQIVQIPTVTPTPIIISSAPSPSDHTQQTTTPSSENTLNTQENETSTKSDTPVNSEKIDDNDDNNNNNHTLSTRTTTTTPPPPPQNTEENIPIATIQTIAKPIPISIEYTNPQNTEGKKPPHQPSQKIYAQMSDLQLVQMYTFCLRLHEKLWEVLARLGNMAESVQANRSLKNLADSAKLLVEVKHIFRDRPKTLDLL